MLDAWRSERFVTYRNLPGWDGPPWSLLLTPGWRELGGRPLAEVVTRQWSTTVDVLLDDLHDSTPTGGASRPTTSWWRSRTEIQRLCAFLEIDWDDELAEPLPDSRHTLDSPASRQVAPQRRRARAARRPRRRHRASARPRCVRPRAADRSRAHRRPAPTPRRDGLSPRRRPPTGRAGRSSASAEPSEQELFGSNHSSSFPRCSRASARRCSSPPTRPVG